MNKVSCYVRTQRLMSGLTQKDLLALLPTTGRNRVSTIERALHPPNGGEILAYHAIFGMPVHELFPKAFTDAEEAVVTKAYDQHQSLQGKTDARSVQKRTFLEGILTRAVERAKSKRV